MCTNNPPKDDKVDDLKEMRDQLKTEEAKVEGRNSDFEEMKTSDTSEQEPEMYEGQKATSFYVLRFDKPVFPMTTFELTDNKYIGEFSKYFYLKS